jgi:hypothetical protein
MHAHLYCRDQGRIPQRFEAGRPIEGQGRPVQKETCEKEANKKKGKDIHRLKQDQNIPRKRAKRNIKAR